MATRDIYRIHHGVAAIAAALAAATFALGSAAATTTPISGKFVPALAPTPGAIAGVTVATIQDEDDCSVYASFRCTRW